MQKHILAALESSTCSEPLKALQHPTYGDDVEMRLRHAGVLPSTLETWSPTRVAKDGDISELTKLGSLDQSVTTVSERGGEVAARASMFAFIKDGLMHYEERRNLPGAQGTSRLSAHLHFGHLSGVEMVKEILKTYPSTLSDDERSLKGQRSAFWGVPPTVEGFLDQIITWRELGYGFCHHTPNYDVFETLRRGRKKPCSRMRMMNDHFCMICRRSNPQRLMTPFGMPRRLNS